MALTWWRDAGEGFVLEEENYGCGERGREVGCGGRRRCRTAWENCKEANGKVEQEFSFPSKLVTVFFVLLIKQQAARFSNGNDAGVSCVDGGGF